VFATLTTGATDASKEVEIGPIVASVRLSTAEAVGISNFFIRELLQFPMNVQIFESMRYSVEACGQIEPSQSRRNCTGKMKAPLGLESFGKMELGSLRSKTMVGFGI
jgi:hypothetical protein